MVAAKPLNKRKIVKKYTGTFKRFQSDTAHYSRGTIKVKNKLKHYYHDVLIYD